MPLLPGPEPEVPLAIPRYRRPVAGWLYTTLMYILSYYETDILGRVAIPRPVATFEKWVTGRVMQRLVLRSVGHGETGFRLRSSVFATPIGKGPCSVLCNRLCRIRAVEMGCKNRSSRSFSRHGEIALQLLRTYLSPVTRVHCTFLNIW